MATIEFTNNYQDLSTDKGFQFKFFCQRCGNGHMSSYRISKLGAATSIIGAAGGLLGGLFGSAASSAYEVQRAVGGKAHDQALEEAVTEIRPKFNQCRRCGTWVCGQVCFNPAANMCKECAPIAEQEESSLRAQNVRTEVGNDLQIEEEVRLEMKKAEAQAKCECGALTLGKKFCPGCGKPTGARPATCPECGAKLPPGAKFCGECGATTVPKPAPTNCPKCDAKLEPGAKFCGECGEKT